MIVATATLVKETVMQPTQLALTPKEISILIKMTNLPLKIMSQLPKEAVAKAMASLVAKGMLTADDMPSQEEMKTFDELAKKLGIPTSDVTLN